MNTFIRSISTFFPHYNFFSNISPVIHVRLYSYLIMCVLYFIWTSVPTFLFFIQAIDKTPRFSIFRDRLYPLPGTLSLSRRCIAVSLFCPDRGSSKYLRNSANAAIYTLWLPTVRINISKLQHSISNHRSTPHNILDTVTWNNPFTFCYRLVIQWNIFQYRL